MRVRVRAALIAVFGSLVAFACTSLDGVSGGDSFPSSDGGDAGDAESADSIAPDSAVHDGPPLGYCAALATKPTHCLDFDEDPPFGTWVLKTRSGAELRVDDGASTSPQRSLHLTTGTSFGDQDTATLYHALVGKPKRVTFSASIRVDKVPPFGDSATLDLVRLRTNNGTSLSSGYSLVDLEISENGSFTVEHYESFGDGGAKSGRQNAGLGTATGKWTRVSITITIGELMSSAKVTVEGQSSNELPLPAHRYPNGEQIFIGEPETQSAWDARFDDVVIDVE